MHNNTINPKDFLDALELSPMENKQFRGGNDIIKSVKEKRKERKGGDN